MNASWPRHTSRARQAQPIGAIEACIGPLGFVIALDQNIVCEGQDRRACLRFYVRRLPY